MNCRKCRYSEICYPFFDGSGWCGMVREDYQIYSRIAEGCPEYRERHE